LEVENIAKKIAILGFGTVGEGVYEGIRSHKFELEQIIGEQIEICAVLVKDVTKKRNIEHGILVTSNIEDIVKIPELHTVFEAIVGAEPCFSYLKALIEKGCNIITANKVMFAHHGKELIKLANEHGATVRYEATVAGGVPIISALSSLLKTNRIEQLQGILNGTSNFILTEMRKNERTFEEALRLAQQLGYAEADPTNDVEGFDAFYKWIILYRNIYGTEPRWNSVYREGISSITSEYVILAKSIGLRFRHVAYMSAAHNYWVKPVLVDESHPFYSVDGVDNTIHVKGSIVGGLTFTGQGAGRFPTASAMIEDFVQMFDQKHPFFSSPQPISENRNKHETSVCQWAIFCDNKEAKQIKRDVTVRLENTLGHLVLLQLSCDERFVKALSEKYRIHVYEILSLRNIESSFKTSVLATENVT